MTQKASHKGLVMPSLIWIAAIGAALLGAYLRGIQLQSLWPVAGVAVFPAAWSLLLSPVLRREWAQLLVIFAWLALAIIACVAIAFIPMAVLFLCAPAAAALFEREKVVEAMVMAAIFAALLYYAGQTGALPEAKVSDTQSLWGRQAGLMATIGLLITAMFGAARGKASAEGGTAVSSGEAEQILNAIDGGVARFRRDGALVSSNRSAREIFGFAKDVDLPLARLLPQDEQAQKTLEALVATTRETAQPQHVTLDTALGGNAPSRLEIRASLIGQDIVLHTLDRSCAQSELVSLRESHMAAEKKTEDKALFFAGVSHELRTPLNAIIGFSDMMRSRLFGPLPSKYAEYADLIHDSGQHMLDVIGDVLDMSKLEAGKYELHYDNFDAADVVRSTLKMIQPAADAAKVQLNIDIKGEDELSIEADRKAVRQILLNLISNAIKFSQPGSAVSIEAQAQGGTLNLTVSDHGVGMSEVELETLGTPYSQMSGGKNSEARGTGLGISLVKSLVELHDGRFAIVSQLGEGTTADVFLPLTRA